MSKPRQHKSDDRDIVRDHYASGYEADRLNSGAGQLERERTRELLLRFLPEAPATVLDVGGGSGEYACWLATLGYEVHLIDLVPVHVDLARRSSDQQPNAPLASVTEGDARSLSFDDESVDAVLLFGPLYHLTERADRIKALKEAYRVLRPEGILMAAGISRFASTLDGLRKEFLKDPRFVKIADQDLKDGQHRNPDRVKGYFTDTFFHHPDELTAEISEAGFEVTTLLGIEGPSWLAPDFNKWWEDKTHRETLLNVAGKLETEPTLIGVSAHLMVMGKKRA